ncbi:MAG TPA: HIT family protein [Gemmataceae bacterium]|nr:HIT family protein [Gemmataceae bacterium]
MAVAANCPFCSRLTTPGGPAGDDVVWEGAQGVAFLGPWQYYRGYCLFVSRTHATELSQLSPPERAAFLEEMCRVAQAIESAFRPHKLNYELLGNQVPHLHWHLFPRSHDDPDALRPVWFALDRAERDEAERRRLQGDPAERPEIRRRLRQFLGEPVA